MANELLINIERRTRTPKPIILIGTDEEKDLYRHNCSAKESAHLSRPLVLSQIIEVIKNLPTKKVSIDSAATVPVMKSEHFEEPAIFDDFEGYSYIPSPQRRKALVVDDNGIELRALKELLEGTYDIMLANSTISALATLEKETPDFILLDYEMPVYNGKMALELIRANPTTANIPVFFLTAVSDRQKIHDVISLHPQGYFLKSSVGLNLIANIEKFFANQRK